MQPEYDVIIVGGGLAGLTAAIELSKSGRRVLVIEKKNYPHHKVCGEYVSNEVLQYLQCLGFNPYSLGAAKIDKLRISTLAGKNIHIPLPLGGFSLSRYAMDHELYKLALQQGTEMLVNTRVSEIKLDHNVFSVVTDTAKAFTSKLVIGSYGKRELLDKKLKRDFVSRHTGYMAVKYHIRTDYPTDEIGLDNFEHGYCGISKIEGDAYNLCYLYKRNAANNYKTIAELEAAVLHKNPMLKKIFANADMIYDAPLAINEISFAPKSVSEQHILMCGDTAGLITPLCGNGMSMAIGGAKLLAHAIKETSILNRLCVTEQDRFALENRYALAWNKQFKKRLYWGGVIQRMLGNVSITGMFLSAVHSIPYLEQKLIKLTHGKEI